MGDVEQTVRTTLAALRRGLGLLADDLDSRVDPEFRRLCGASTATGEVLRDRITDHVHDLAAGLSEELELAALVALNLHPPAHSRYLRERLAWLAERMRADVRTARRRVDEAFERMARNATAPDAGSGLGHGGNGWYVEQLDTVLRLTTATPEAFERRTVVVTVAELTELVHSTSIPNPGAPDEPPDLQLDLVFGGVLSTVQRHPGGNFDTVVTLPEPLGRGDRHEYSMLVRIPPGQPMVPHYVLVPLRKHKHFTLRVCFPREALPRRVWRVAALPPRAIDARVPSDSLLVPDRAGEVRAEFHDLLPGCGYGVQWEP